MGRLLIVDDHPIFLQGLYEALSATGEWKEIVRSSSGEEALSTFRAGGADLALLDLALPDMGGLDLARLLIGEPIAPLVFILSMNADRASVRRAFEAGARGYASKNISIERLRAAIQVVLVGELFIEGELLSDFLDLRPGTSAESEAVAGKMASLTERERAVLEAMLAGESSKAIAGRFGVSVRSAENWQGMVFDKMGARTPLELASIAMRAGVARASQVD